MGTGKQNRKETTQTELKAPHQLQQKVDRKQWTTLPSQRQAARLHIWRTHYAFPSSQAACAIGAGRRHHCTAPIDASQLAEQRQHSDQNWFRLCGTHMLGACRNDHPKTDFGPTPHAQNGRACEQGGKQRRGHMPSNAKRESQLVPHKGVIASSSPVYLWSS